MFQKHYFHISANTILFIDILDNCTAEAITSSLLNLLNNRVNLHMVLTAANNDCKIKIITYQYTAIYFYCRINFKF